MVQQGDNVGEWLPIVFGSRVLDHHELNYPINQLEQLAIVTGYRECYYLFYGKQTIIYCDNKPSVDRATKTEQNFLSVLAALVNDTHSKVVYMPGKENGVSDFLSRYHAPQINTISGSVKRDMPYLENIQKQQDNI